MPRFHRKITRPATLPHLWLFTDERIDAASLLAAAHALPARSGIIFRHYSLPREERRTLFAAVQRVARRKGLALMLAGGWREALLWGADGWHGRGGGRRYPGPRPLLHSASAHDAREICAARRGGADMIFLSPVFPTRSHEGGRTLGPLGFARLARLTGTLPAKANTKAMLVALGGMDARRGARLRPMGSAGWGAIDALSNQKKERILRT